MWYSFNVGAAHFISLNTETDYPNSPAERKKDSHNVPNNIFKAGGFAPEGELIRWLESDLQLANENRDERPWIIVGAHRPIYDNYGVQDANLQSVVEDLFLKYGVDAYFSGHMHSYARTDQIYNGEVQPGAPIHIMGE